MSEWQTCEGDSKRIFYCAYHSIKNNIEVERYLSSVENYLKGFKKYSNDNQIFNLIFKTSWKESEIHNLAFAHVLAARITIKRLLQNFQRIDNDVLKELIIDLICDLEFWIKKIDSSQDFSWFIMNTNSSDSQSYYKSVRSALYGVDTERSITYDSRFVNATLLIRNTIEQRIKGLLGINSINRSGGKVPLSFLITVLCESKYLNLMNGVDLKKIGKINNWANHFLHCGTRPYPWQLEWAENEIGKMFFVGYTSDKKTYSIHAAFETENLKLLRNEVETRINEKYGVVQIGWTNFGEVYELHKRL